MFESIITEMFVKLDDFCRQFEPQWQKSLLPSDGKHRNRGGQLCLSEKLTIIVGFQASGFRTFKSYYQFVEHYHRREFPNLVSYNRFIQVKPKTLLPLCAYLLSRRGQVTGRAFHRQGRKFPSVTIAELAATLVLRGLAQRGKTSIDWFFGFKV